jgi:hypothetical protein
VPKRSPSATPPITFTPSFDGSGKSAASRSGNSAAPKRKERAG